MDDMFGLFDDGDYLDFGDECDCKNCDRESCGCGGHEEVGYIYDEEFGELQDFGDIGDFEDSDDFEDVEDFGYIEDIDTLFDESEDGIYDDEEYANGIFDSIEDLYEDSEIEFMDDLDEL